MDDATIATQILRSSTTNRQRARGAELPGVLRRIYQHGLRGAVNDFAQAAQRILQAAGLDVAFDDKRVFFPELKKKVTVSALHNMQSLPSPQMI